jgi:hypothetical protein
MVGQLTLYGENGSVRKRKKNKMERQRMAQLIDDVAHTGVDTDIGADAYIGIGAGIDIDIDILNSQLEQIIFIAKGLQRKYATMKTFKQN